MPYSSPIGKEQIQTWCKEYTLPVNRILDIGVGSGTYSKLLRENGIFASAEWIGIEAWEPYINKYNLNKLYNKVIVQDARQYNFHSLGNIDIAFAGDMLEHMQKEDAIQLVDKILEISKILIISIPIRFLPQEAYQGNPFEIHVKPDWTNLEVLDTWGKNIFNSYLKSKKTKIGVYWLKK